MRLNKIVTLVFFIYLFNINQVIFTRDVTMTLMSSDDEGLTPTKDGGTCLRRLSMFRKEVH